MVRVVYSVLRELDKGDFIPNGNDYGLNVAQFDNFIWTLEKIGYIDRVLRVNGEFSLKPARVTIKGKELLQKYNEYEAIYPQRQGLKDWVQIDKKKYSNGATDDTD